MSWSGGVFTRTNGVFSGSVVWVSDAAASINILADRHDVHDADLAAGINACINKAGQNSPIADISWGGFKLTSLGNGTAPSDAAAFGQTITALSFDAATRVLTGTRAAANVTVTMPLPSVSGHGLVPPLGSATGRVLTDGGTFVFLNADSVNAGVFDEARIPAIPPSKLSGGTATAGQVLAWDTGAAQWLPISPTAAGVTTWGTISGTLADQGDLTSALNGKAASSHTHTLPDIQDFGVAGGYIRSNGSAWVRVAGIAWADLIGVPSTFTPASHTHSASDIASGTLSAARIPGLDASHINSGVFATTRLASGSPSSGVWLRGDGIWAALPSTAAPTWGAITGSLSAQTDLNSALNARQPLDGDLTAIAALATTGVVKRTGTDTWSAGTLLAADIPALDAAKITTGTFAAGQIPALDAAKITTGTFAAGRIPSLDATKITTGVLAAARLGSGSPTSDSILRGNGSWTGPTFTASITTVGSVTPGQGTAGAKAFAKLSISTSDPVLGDLVDGELRLVY